MIINYYKVRYQVDPKYRKYVHGYSFSSFARKFGSKYGKKITDAVVNPKNKYGKK